MEIGEEATLPVPKPFAADLMVTGMRRYDSETKKFSSRVALFCDLKEFGLYDEEAAPDLPRWLVATHDERTGAQQAFLCKTQEVARKYVAFVGIRHDDAARAREQSFRECLNELADGPLAKDQTLPITLARSEYLKVAAATPGKELIRAMPSAVIGLLLLLGVESGEPLSGEQVTLIKDAIGKNLPQATIPFLLPRLCARYAQKQVALQKKILKDLEKAATFKKNRDAYLRAQQPSSLAS